MSALGQRTCTTALQMAAFRGKGTAPFALHMSANERTSGLISM